MEVWRPGGSLDEINPVLSLFVEKSGRPRAGQHKRLVAERVGRRRPVHALSGSLFTGLPDVPT